MLLYSALSASRFIGSRVSNAEHRNALIIPTAKGGLYFHSNGNCTLRRWLMNAWWVSSSGLSTCLLVFLCYWNYSHRMSNMNTAHWTGDWQILNRGHNSISRTNYTTSLLVPRVRLCFCRASACCRRCTADTRGSTSDVIGASALICSDSKWLVFSDLLEFCKDSAVISALESTLCSRLLPIPSSTLLRLLTTPSVFASVEIWLWGKYMVER